MSESLTQSVRGPANSYVLQEVRLVPLSDPGVNAGAPSEVVDVLVHDGVVTALGPNLPAPAGVEVVATQGRWLIPGLWDQHVHMAQWAANRARIDLSGTRGPQEVVQRVADRIADLPAGSTELVSGYGYRSAVWPSQPTVAALDAVSAGHPVVLISGDAHNGWLNTRALELLGMPVPDGALDENDWFPVFGRLGELPGAGERSARDYREACRAASALGVVGIVDLEFGANLWDWPQRWDSGVDSLRARVGVYPDHVDRVIEAGWRTGEQLPGCGDLITMGPLKMITDGSLNTRTALCFEPFADAGEMEHPRGKRNYPPQELHALVRQATRSGLECALHAIGDQAVEEVLTAFEQTGARGSIEHAQLTRPSDIARMARMGVRASVQPAHLWDDRDVTMQCWPDRAERTFMLRAMHEAGVRLAMGSDAPVAALDPWLAMAAAVHRSADQRPPFHAEQALTAREALAASVDGVSGVRAGMAADLALLDADPLAGSDDDSAQVANRLRDLPVAATMVAGRFTHWRL